MTSWFVVQKTYSKMHLVSCSNTHRDVTDLVNHGMVKNAKTWISFLKILNLCFRWHILRSYCFVEEVTFKDWVFSKWAHQLILYERIIVLIFSKVISCSWRCGCHRFKTAIIKGTCPLILTSSPIFDGIFCTPISGWKGPKSRVCLAFCPCLCLSVSFRGVGSLFFSET